MGKVNFLLEKPRLEHVKTLSCKPCYMNLSKFLLRPVEVETCNGTVEGTLIGVDYALSKHSKTPHPKWLILENRDSNPTHVFIIRDWHVVKKVTA